MQQAISARRRIYNLFTGNVTLVVITLFFIFAFSLIAYISIYAGNAYAAPNSYINFQARVLTNNGAVVPDGPYSVEFRLYTLSGGGSSVWNETQAVTVKNGYITASLGSNNAFGTSIDWSQELWLTMNVNGDGEMSPRMRITAVPYAFRAGQALNVLSSNTSAASTNSDSITVQTGNASGAGSNSGNISVDSGTATGTTGSISIGAVNASGITIGRIGLQTNIAGNALISGGTATLGTSTQAGSLVLNDGNGGQTTTLQAGNSAGNLTFTLPTTTGAALECLQNSATPGVLQFGACGAGGGTLQNAYDNSVGGIITVNTTDGAFRVRDNAVTLGNNSIFAVQNNGATVDYLAVQGDGDVSFDTNTLFVDAVNNRVGIGTATPASVLNVTNTAPASVAGATGTAQIAVGNFAGGTGGATTIATTGTGGTGGAFTVTGGAGGQASSALVSSTGGAGGALNLTGGSGGAAVVAGTGNNIGGTGGAFNWLAGTGGAATGATSGNNTGGNGGAISLQAGAGGAANTGTGNLVGGTGGTLTLSGGTGGVGATSGGNGGAVTLQGGTAAAMAGAAGGAVTVTGRAGSATGSGGAGGALTLTAGSAGGDNTVNRAGGAITITAGASRGASNGGAISITAGSGGQNLTVAANVTGPASGGITINGGNGGTAPNATTTSTGGAAGGLTFNGGIGGTASVAGTVNNVGGGGGTTQFIGGTGGSANGVTSGSNSGGAGGGFILQGGTGGAASNGTGVLQGGTGGTVQIVGGTGGTGTTGGNGGAITIQGGASAAIAGAAGGAVTISGTQGSNTGSGGAGGALTLAGGNARGDNTVSRTGGALSITAGNSIGGANGGAVTITAGNGGTNLTVGTATGGSAGGITFNGGNGASATNANVSSTGGTAGGFTINGGTGGAASVAGTGNNTGGNGGSFTWTAGNGGAANGATSGINTGGLGGTVTLRAGNGGAASTGTGTLQGGAGGGLILQAGTGGTGTVAGTGGAVTLRGGTSNTTGGDIILETAVTTTLTERMRVTNSGYVGIGTSTTTSLPNARLTVVAENVTNSQIKLRSQRVGVVANNLIGGVDFDSNDSSLTAPGVTTARIQAVATATHTAAVNDTALVFSTSSGATLTERWRINAAGEFQGNGASVLRANGGNLTISTVTSGNVVIDGAGTLEVQDNININSSQLTVGSSTVNTVSALGNFAVNGNIGTALATVDIRTAFTINQTTAGRTLTLPTPTANTVAGRIVYVSNIGTTSFTMHGVTIASGATQSFIYNGTVWAPTNVGGAGAGVNAVGAIDSQTKSADGAVISGTTIYLQTADATNPGLISTGLQTLAGAKTFTGATSFTSAGTGLSVTNDASVGGALSVVGTTTLSSGLIASGSSTVTTGTTSGTGTNTTNLTLSADSFNVNDVVFIDNVGQDYYTRITVDPGTGSYTVSPAVTFETSRTVTKYNVQNIGATATDYSNLNNRFFQGYFLGGVVIGTGSTTIGDGVINSTTTLRLQENGNALSIGGALNVTGTISGDASGLTNIDASQITSGAVSDSNLSSNVTLLGNTFNGASQLVQLDGSGYLPILNGSALTNLNASNLISGTVADARLSSNVTTQGNTFNGVNQLVKLDGTGALAALNGSALTDLNASNIASGTLSDSRLSTNVTLLGNSFNGNNQLLQLSAGGLVNDSLLSTNITKAGNTFNGANGLVQLDGSGNLPSLNGSALTNLNGSNISSGTVADARLTSNVTLLGNTFNGASQLVQLDGSGYLPILNGSALTNLNASNLSSGTVADARLSSNVTTQGNTFNGVNQLVKLDGTGALAALNGSALTDLNASNIASGTLSDSRLSSNVTLLGNSFNGNNQLLQLSAGGLVNDSLLSTNITKAGNTFNGANGLVQLDGSGNLPSLNGSALTNLNGSNITSGTVADARLTSNVTLLGNTFNGASQLVQLDGSGYLPILNGSALTNLNASNLSSGTVADARLSSNVTTQGNTFNGVNQLVKLDGTGALVALNGSALTDLNASNIASGTLSDSRLSSNVTLLGNSFNGNNQLLQLSAGGLVNDSLLSTNITKAGNTFNGANGLVQLDGSGNLPSLNGSALTNLNGSNITSGTVADARLTSNVTLLGNTFNGASQLVQLDGSGYLPILNGSALTNLNASNLSSGTVADARLSSNVTTQGNTFNGVNQLVKLDGTGALAALNGSALTDLNASNIASGTLSDSRLSSNVTLLGNSFNGNNQLLQLSAGGLVNDSLLSTNITKAGNTFNGANGLVQLDGSGNLPSLNGSALTNLNGSNITSGTVADARLTSNVTLLGNTFNGASQLVQLDGSGALLALNANALTSLNGSNVSSGTIADARLSTNVALLNISQTFSAAQSFSANIVLGNDTASPTRGLLTLNDATGSNGFTSVLGTNTLTSNRAIDLPDEDGTICLRDSANCGFVLFGKATAQTDSSTNTSIFINKTGASGNILTLQKNGTSFLNVLNSGAFEIRLTDTAAFSVKNASGTDFFNVDTSGALVRIGASTADANATLLVLDTKNTAGDPSGTNGGSYYNSASGKTRCYENGTWMDCVTAVNKNKSAVQTVTNSATFTNDSALVYAMAANSSYNISASINFSGTSAAADFKYTFTAPAGSTLYLATDAATGNTTNTICNITASGQTCTVLIAANFRGIIQVRGTVITGANSGNIQFQFAQNTQTAGQSVSVYQGSLLQVTRTDQ